MFGRASILTPEYLENKFRLRVRYLKTSLLPFLRLDLLSLYLNLVWKRILEQYLWMKRSLFLLEEQVRNP